jgi:hypothetical protein
VNSITGLILSPLGPVVVLAIGAAVLMSIGRRIRRPTQLTGIALIVVAIASWFWLQLRFQQIVPIFSFPWKPLLQTGANLEWLGDGWNWYISGLLLLLSGLGILVDVSDIDADEQTMRHQRLHIALGVHLAVLAASLLFVGSNNLLTAILTWVLLDLLLLMRVHPETHAGETASDEDSIVFQDAGSKGFSLLGALLLMIGLLPAGVSGPGQAFLGGSLAQETVMMMLLAAALRAGIYPFHLWLLPKQGSEVNLSERLLEQMVPTLCGLWLGGWAISLGGGSVLFMPEVVTILILMLLLGSLAAFFARDQATHTTLVLVNAAGVAALCGALAEFRGPSALLWPTTAFALGGALWLIGERVWRTWGWQLPVSIGALTMAGVPFTPGFLSQGSLARMLTLGLPFTALFVLYVMGQTFQIAALLRSWGGAVTVQGEKTPISVMWRLLVACVALGLPLALTGILPNTVALLASLPGLIPSMLGSPPSVVAEFPVWISLAVPLLLGILLVWLWPLVPAQATGWLSVVGEILRLDWLFRFGWWSIHGLSDILGSALRVIEGAGALGWLLVFLLLGYLLGR